MLLFLLLVLTGETFSQNDWWKNAIFYQIYPRSFKDNNNDGIGDLEGIISKMEHLKDMDVSGVWMSPIYKSPQIDQGYDISDFKDIHEAYGTMETFQKLVQKANQYGIKVIMDFVPNHTSDQHEWFMKSLKGDPDYADFYVWKVGKNNNTEPPNNWLSLFKNSAWTYREERKLWYLHQFTKEQPDLNYRNPAVVKEMKDVLTFWLDKGAHGFRVDAITSLFEDGELTDNPPSNNNGLEPNDPLTQIHTYTENRPETYDMVYQWRELLDEYSKKDGVARIMMTEAYGPVESTVLYQGDGKRNGAHFSFNFYLINDVDKKSNAKDFVATLEKWLKNISKKSTPNWVLGNHDNPRVATRFGPDNVDGFNTLDLLLPGIAVTYNGEEIGQENGEVKFEEGKDPRARENEEDFLKNSRDFERTPYQWDNSTNAGFNDGAKPWLPVSEKYKIVNLKAQIGVLKSHYQIYKYLVRLRKRPQFLKGATEILVLSEYALGFTRSLSEYPTYYIVFNVGDNEETIGLGKFSQKPPTELRVVITSIKSKRKRGDSISSKKIKMDAHECLVLVGK